MNDVDVWEMQQTNATTFQLAMHRIVQTVGTTERRLSLEFIRQEDGQRPVLLHYTTEKQRTLFGDPCIIENWVPGSRHRNPPARGERQPPPGAGPCV